LASLVLLLLPLAAPDLDAAEKALAAGRPREALRLLGNAADVEDADVRAYVVQGRAYLALREYQAAVEPLLRASDLRPDDKALARDAAWACWGSATGAYALAYLEDARRMARRSGDEKLLADLHFAAGDFEQALEAYRALEPKTLAVVVRVAECLDRLGRETVAKQAWNDALEEAVREDDVRTAYRAAFKAGRAGRYLAWLDSKLETNPDDVDARVHRGFARAASLMYREAAQDLRLVVEERPDYRVAKELLADVLVRYGQRKQKAEAVREGEALARGILAEGRSDRAWKLLEWLSGVHWTDRDIERYYELTKFLHGIDPGDLDVGLNFAGAARRLGRYDEARAALLRLLEASPEDPDVLNDLGILEDGLGDRDRARELWRRVLREEPDNLNALENLFTDAWERGDSDAMDSLAARGLAAARDQDGPVGRWPWFEDRRFWAPRAFGEASR